MFLTQSMSKLRHTSPGALLQTVLAPHRADHHQVDEDPHHAYRHLHHHQRDHLLSAPLLAEAGHVTRVHAAYDCPAHCAMLPRAPPPSD